MKQIRLFYSMLDQWVSFTGGVTLVAVNTVWLGQLIFYSMSLDSYI